MGQILNEAKLIARATSLQYIQRADASDCLRHCIGDCP